MSGFPLGASDPELLEFWPEIATPSAAIVGVADESEASRLPGISARRKLAFIEQAAKTAGVTVEGSHDHPWEIIVRTAKEKGCDLIAMASHWRRGLSAMILGTFSSFIELACGGIREALRQRVGSAPLLR